LQQPHTATTTKNHKKKSRKNKNKNKSAATNADPHSGDIVHSTSKRKKNKSKKSSAESHAVIDIRSFKLPTHNNQSQAQVGQSLNANVQRDGSRLVMTRTKKTMPFSSAEAAATKPPTVLLDLFSFLPPEEEAKADTRRKARAQRIARRESWLLAYVYQRIFLVVHAVDSVRKLVSQV
jgi:hypothetical protein